MSIEAALFGTLSRDCERKTSKNGKPYLRLNVACSEGETTTWVSAMVFDERAIAVADRLLKGSRVYLGMNGQRATARSASASMFCHGIAALLQSVATNSNPTSRNRRHSLRPRAQRSMIPSMI